MVMPPAVPPENSAVSLQIPHVRFCVHQGPNLIDVWGWLAVQKTRTRDEMSSLSLDLIPWGAPKTLFRVIPGLSTD
jgi:hypothetical protein